MAVHPFYVIRLLGGLFFLTGALIMVYNLIPTVRGASPSSASLRAPARHSRREE